MAEVTKKGKYIKETWGSWVTDIPVIKDCRGLGMMLALELMIPSKQVMTACLDAGLIVNAVTDSAIRVLPALNITNDELDAGLAIMKQVLKKF